MLKRFAYLGYYLKELDRRKFLDFLAYTAATTGISKTRLLFDAVASSLKYNISLLEYFQFRFFSLDRSARQAFAGTGFMYEYQLIMNPRNSRAVLSDKIKFLDTYKAFVNHASVSLTAATSDPEQAQRVLDNPSKKIVLKSSDGQCGIGIVIKDASAIKGPGSLISELKKTNNDLAEEFVVQHPDLMRLSPSGLNTVRIITQLDSKKNVLVLGARLRITINSGVDNLAAGNMAAPIDPETGIVSGAGVFSDIRKKDLTHHPVTGIGIVGFQVPYWNETLAMVKRAALVVPENRSIGWDIAITTQGPELIEGNHDWCKLLWQLPAKKGLKPMLEKYLDEK